MGGGYLCVPFNIWQFHHIFHKNRKSWGDLHPPPPPRPPSGAATGYISSLKIKNNYINWDGRN